MDIAHHYANSNGDRATIYLDPWFTTPLSLTLERDGTTVDVFKLDADSLRCTRVVGIKGECTDADCHRRPLGECACKRHDRASFRTATS